jgi:hypothetical protein
MGKIRVPILPRESSLSPELGDFKLEFLDFEFFLDHLRRTYRGRIQVASGSNLWVIDTLGVH